jgi:hypothetical protein
MNFSAFPCPIYRIFLNLVTPRIVVKRTNNEAADYFEDLKILFSSEFHIDGTENCGQIFMVQNNLEPATQRTPTSSHVATGVGMKY